jgi:uncharacterized protein YbjT (DUF2867 family)
MDVVVAGGHGKVAQRLERLLAERGHRARGLVRDRDHVADLERLGAEGVVCDLEAEDDLSGVVEGADAVVFAAGAGPGSGPERKRTVDLGAALKLIDAARAQGIARYVMVSAIGAEDPARGPERMRPYLEAKAEADRALAGSGLDYTIVRPGGLTDAPGTGRVAAGPDVARGQIPRDDVAAVLLAVLEADGPTAGKAFRVVAGETPIEEAIRTL